MTFNFPLSPPKSLHANYAHAPFKTCPYQPLNQTKTRAVTGVFTPQRCANVCCCNLQLFLLLCKPFLQQQTFAQQQKQLQVAGANVCTTTKTVAGCSSKALQTFRKVCRVFKRFVTFANLTKRCAACNLRRPRPIGRRVAGCRRHVS